MNDVCPDAFINVPDRRSLGFVQLSLEVIERGRFCSSISTVDLCGTLSDDKPLPEFAFAFVQVGLLSGSKPELFTYLPAADSLWMAFHQFNDPHMNGYRSPGFQGSGTILLIAGS